MLNKILVIAPYNVDLLKALVNAVVSKIADIIVVGEKNKIVEICFLNNINYHLFDTIIDQKFPIDICYAANIQIKRNAIKTIVFGDFPADLQHNIAIAPYEIDIIDIPRFKHLLFTCINTEAEYIGYEEKKEAVVIASGFMRDLKINFCAVGLVCSNANKTSNIERNVIKMTPDLDVDLIDIIEPKDIFEKKHNLLIFNSYDANRIFLETLVNNDEVKCAKVKKASSKYLIDAKGLRLKDIFFSIFITNKLCLNSEVS